MLKLIKGNSISVKELAAASETEPKVDRGEWDCLNLCKQEQISILVTDDWRALPKLIEKSAFINVVVSAFVIRALLNSSMLTRTEAKAVLDKIAQNRDWLESKIYEESKKWLTK